MATASVTPARPLPASVFPWPAARAILPATRWEVPGWGRLADRFKLFDHAADGGPWRGAPTKVVRGKWHRYLMDLDLANWSERQTYFLGRFYDLQTQQLMARFVRPGERVVDAGANIGMLTLHAAALVGPAGRVDAFEPNPTCQRRIRSNLDRNGIRHVHLHPVGLGEAAATLQLQVVANHTGTGTLCPLDGPERQAVTDRLDVPIIRGDDVLLADDQPIVLVKVDVEGFEVHALRGMADSLRRWRPVVTTEMRGPKQGPMREFMADLGYAAYLMRSARRGLRHALSLVPVGAIREDEMDDVVWTQPDGPSWERLKPFVVAA